MCPPSRMCGRQRRVIRIRPCTFVSITVCSSSSLDSVNGSRPSAQPGVVDEDVEPAERLDRRVDEASQLAGSVTSSASATTVADLEPVDAARAGRDPARPRRASARAVAAPIPLEAPVTIAVLPSSEIAGTAGATGATARGGGTTARARSVPRRVLDLERRVLEPEALAPAAASSSRRRAWQSAPGVDEHVRRERGEAARQRPDVQVVHLDDARLGDDRAPDLLRVDVAGRRLEQDPRRLAQQAERAPRT